MSTGTILEIACDVADELGLTRPETLFGAYNEGDTTDLKLRRAAIATSRFIHRYWNWPVVTNEASFIASANGVQPGALPTDFDRLVKDTMIETRQRVPVMVSSQVPVAFPGQPLPVRPVAIIRGNGLHYYSPFPPGGTVAFTYIRNWMAEEWEGQESVFKPTFTNDRDRSVFDDEVMHRGMMWTILHREGNTNNVDYEAFRNTLHERMNNVSGDGDLTFGDQDTPETNYPMTPWGT